MLPTYMGPICYGEELLARMYDKTQKETAPPINKDGPQRWARLVMRT